MRAFTQDDRATVMEFLGRVNRAEKLLTSVHTGDFLHYITNIVRGANPSESVFLDEIDGELRAVATLYPRWTSYALTVHPSYRGGEYERDLLAWCETERWAWILRDGVDKDGLMTDALDTDAIRIALLQSLGYTTPEPPIMALTIRDLENIPAPILPDGFSVRPATDVSEAGALAVVHSGAFNSGWTSETYAAVMQAPGFTINNEMVVVAPAGDFAAFLVYWLDPISQSGLFEPVGCHPDYQRRGLVKALMSHTMSLMRDAGMTKAIVKHELGNEASTAAYASLGFVRAGAYTDWFKKLR